MKKIEINNYEELFLLKAILKENGYFVLLCFSVDEEGAEENVGLQTYDD